MTLRQQTTTVALLFIFACSSAKSGPPEADQQASGLGARLVFAVNIPAQATVSRAEILDQALTIVRNRIDHLQLREPAVYRQDDRIVVEFVDADLDQVELAEKIVTRGAALRFRLAVHDHPGMRALCRIVENQAPLPAPSVSAVDDSWRNQQTGQSATDCFLAAAERSILVDYIAAHADEIALSGAETIVYEEQPPRADQQQASWRTHVINKTSVLTGAHVRNARVEINQQSSRPEVRLEFNDDGRRLFAFITENKIGDKLVMTLDDRVLSAPLIHDRVTGGVSVITLGHADDAAETRREALELVDAIRTGALPAPLRLESAISFAVK